LVNSVVGEQAEVLAAINHAEHVGDWRQLITQARLNLVDD